MADNTGSMTKLTFEAQMAQLAQDLYEFMASIEAPRLMDNAWADKVVRVCNDLSDRVSRTKKQASKGRKRFRSNLDRIYHNLMEYTAELADRPSITRLSELAKSLSLSYEEMLANLRQARGKTRFATSLAHLKPKNYARNLFHVLNGLGLVVMYQWVVTWEQGMIVLTSLLATAYTLEITRRFSPRWNEFLVHKVFGAVSRPRELTRTNSATYYLTAVTIICFLMPKLAVELGVLTLAFGDPAASIVGKKWGVRKLWKQKSVLGTITFTLTAFLVMMGFMLLVSAPLSLPLMFGVAAAVAVSGAVTELFCSRLDDNFTIPMICAGIATLIIGA